MGYRKAIKEGLKTLNRNYQLLFIHTGVLIIAFLLFLIIVGTPIIIVLAKSGFELPEKGFTDLLKTVLTEGVRTYLSIIATILLSLSVYVFITSVIFIYAIAGTSGVLLSSLSGREGYSWGLFHSYGRRFFKEFLLLSIIGVIALIFLSFIAGLISGLMKSTTIPLSNSENLLKNLFANFFNLLSILLSLSMLIFFMATFTYGAGLILLKEDTSGQRKKVIIRVFDSLTEAFNLLIKKPQSLVFYGLISLGAIILMLFLGTLGTILKGGGFVLYQLLLSIVQIYINLSVVSCAFVYLKESL